MARRRTRKLTLNRMLQIAIPLFLVFGFGWIVLQHWWLQGRPWGVPQKGYLEFEQELRDGKVKRALCDGNIIRAEYEGATAVVLSPSPERTIDLMIKRGVQVEALRPVPASGMSLPVLALAMLPYPILAYLAVGLLGSVQSEADFSDTEQLVRHAPAEPPKEPAPELPHALADET